MNRAIRTMLTNEPITIPAIAPSERPFSVGVGNKVEDTKLAVLNMFIELDNIDEDPMTFIK